MGGHSVEIIKHGGKVLGIEMAPEMMSFTEVDGIIFDLGVAPPQLISSDRGFSFTNEESLLDMRLSSPTQGVTAADLVNSLGKKDLVKLFREVMNSKDAIRL